MDMELTADEREMMDENELAFLRIRVSQYEVALQQIKELDPQNIEFELTETQKQAQMFLYAQSIAELVLK